MTLLTSLENDAKQVGAAVKGVFTGLNRELESFFSEGATAIASTIKTQLPTATTDIVRFLEASAVGAVEAAELTPGTGQAKMAAALAAFTASLASKGIALVETEMRALLENALLVYKASSAAGAAGA